MKRLLMLTCAAAMACGAAASSITVDSVIQRWPWNNKVDITYTVSDGQDVGAGVYARIVFTASIGTTNITIDGVHDVGADASDGTHTVTWTLPSYLKAKGCTMTAQLFSADNPSGDDYMVIDLATGVISYEGMLATQDDSNARYNTATYKTEKMVLRKVPRWGNKDTLPNAAALSSMSGYPTGENTSNKYYSHRNYWATDRDYYIGVFPITQCQYATICGSNPSYFTADTAGNLAAHRPAERMSWDALRLSSTASTSSIPAVDSESGTFFQRLNYRTGRYFDLPTEVMFEIAERAGSLTDFYWGDDMNADFVVCSENSGGSTAAVGSKPPNAWGLYDMAGNVWEWCLDCVLAEDAYMTGLADAFTSAFGDEDSRRCRGGGSYGESSSISSKGAFFRSAARYGELGKSAVDKSLGFRISMIAD